MKTEAVVEYIADDGKRFRSEAECLNYEAELEAVGEIMSRIPESRLEFGTYRQHDRNTLLQIRRDLWQLVLAKYGDRWSGTKWKEWNADEVHPMSIVGRVLSDSGHGPIEKAWHRLGCFDFELGREYDQPYFVAHSSEAKLEQKPVDVDAGETPDA